MHITANSYASVFSALAGIIAMAIALLILQGMLTQHNVPDSIETDCFGAQVLDPVTHTCGGQ